MIFSYVVATCVGSFGRNSKAKSNTQKKKCARSENVHCLEITPAMENKRLLFKIEIALEFYSMWLF
jgi:hypothetical protein